LKALNHRCDVHSKSLVHFVISRYHAAWCFLAQARVT
jgi:hypothetical protein